MSKTLYEVRLFLKGEEEQAPKRGTLHPGNQVQTYLVRASSVSLAMMAIENDEDTPIASTIGRIEINLCTRYTKFIGAQESI